jgi:hypothetical protein
VAEYISSEILTIEAIGNSIDTEVADVGTNTDVGKDGKDSDGDGTPDSEEPDEQELANLDEYLERYYNISKAIDVVTKRLENMSKELDKTWGAERVEQLQKLNEELVNKRAKLIQKDAEILATYAFLDRPKVEALGF